MAGKSTTLTVKIVSDAKGAAAGFDDAESRVEKFSRGLDKASVAAGGVLVGLGTLAKSAFDAASDLEQSTGAIDSVFGDWALDIEQHAQTAADSVGLSQSAYQQLASTVGATMKGLGQSNGEAMDSTTALIQTGADLAATFGGPTSDAVAALGSLMRGERDPIERYGISISAASVEARIAALGLDTSTDAAKRNAQATATMSLVQEQAGGALGAFAREADTAAGSTAIASAKFEDAKAALGESLLPVVADAADKFADLTDDLDENKDSVEKVVLVVGALAAGVIAINAAVKTYEAVVAVATAVQWAWNAALDANPITLVVLAIAALAFGVYLAYQKFEPFRNVVDSVGHALKSAFQTGVEWCGRMYDKIKGLLDFAKRLGGGVLGKVFGAPAGPAPLAGAGALRSAAPGLRGATFSSGAGGVGPAAGAGGSLPVASTTNVTVNVKGFVGDRQELARAIRSALGNLDVAQGRSVAVAL